jgi:hypothetical protein
MGDVASTVLAQGQWWSERYFVLSVAARGWTQFWLAHIHGLGERVA